MTGSRISELILRAHSDPGFRGKLIWFPEEIAADYGLDERERLAISTGDMSGIDLADDVREVAGWVFNLHDQSAGE
jgi:hypothetical protein